MFWKIPKMPNPKIICVDAFSKKFKLFACYVIYQNEPQHPGGMVFNSVEFGCTTDSHSPMNILLAEDDPANQRVTLIMLKRLGYNADAVNNGLQVLKALEKRMYDLVLMDIVMPKMDGFEATKEIRKRYPSSKKPIIIALTAYILPDGRERCIEAGMNDYMAKPVRMSELADALGKCPPAN